MGVGLCIELFTRFLDMPILYLKKPYILKVRTRIEILPWNGSHMKGAQIGNFSQTGSYVLGSFSF